MRTYHIENRVHGTIIVLEVLPCRKVAYTSSTIHASIFLSRHEAADLLVKARRCSPFVTVEKVERV